LAKEFLQKVMNNQQSSIHEEKQGLWLDQELCELKGFSGAILENPCTLLAFSLSVSTHFIDKPVAEDEQQNRTERPSPEHSPGLRKLQWYLDGPENPSLMLVLPPSASSLSIAQHLRDTEVLSVEAAETLTEVDGAPVLLS